MWQRVLLCFRRHGKIRNQLERILDTGGFTGPQYAVNTVGRRYVANSLIDRTI
jgi:hypothetical protein